MLTLPYNKCVHVRVPGAIPEAMINFYFLLEPVTDELVEHTPDRDEALINHIMNIFMKGVLAK